MTEIIQTFHQTHHERIYIIKNSTLYLLNLLTLLLTGDILIVKYSKRRNRAKQRILIVWVIFLVVKSNHPKLTLINVSLANASASKRHKSI
jgi:hypothetical protein